MTGTAGKTILHLIDTTGPGGAETVFISLLDKLKGTEFQNVVVLRGEGWVADQVRSLGLSPHIIDSKGSFNLGYIRALRHLLKAEKVDLIHAHLLGSNVYGALLALICRTPMIATFHGAVDVAAGERFLRTKFSIIGWGASSVVCVSKRLQYELAERSPLPKHKLKLIYNGVNPEIFSRAPATALREELGLSEDATLVVSVGNVRPAKGYEYLVDAAVNMADVDTNTHFIVVGHQREELFNKLKAQVAEAPRQPNIHWLGFRQDVADVLRQADIFLLPSISEGFSISTVEAMMAGVPVIATRSGGPEEIIVDGESGLLVPIKDPDAIVRAILNLKETALCREVTERARKTAYDRFSLESMLQSYFGLYQSLVTR
ncbi:glycosyltransferase family 1 protein [Marinobacter sp. NP-4(2019)]|uniref:glycosyltransferase family 4 protein n=1 Tax=Marinobacter sp. NP-4(2019) TaxID=2488665 RepID=UPI000FC3D8A4|nr:glycosyltransferase family 4 protein [Marinobacter sp. NP-4(2019)]AZT84121.1 glycosyltransferase family 1 protein [Marinobacter sp. NP-4(2019)]